jgi:hypothetical protein
MTGASAGPQLLGEAIRHLIGSPPAAARMAAAARASLSSRFTGAALRDAALAYATGPGHCQRGHPTGLPHSRLVARYG